MAREKTADWKDRKIRRVRAALLRRTRAFHAREAPPLTPYRPGANIRSDQRARYELKTKAWRLSGGYCVYCLDPLLTEVTPFHVDHIVPRSQGGPDIIDNLLPACERCNCSRGVKPFVEFARTFLEQDHA